VTIGSHTQSAGTSEIARRSGGDSMPVDDAYALDSTLSRLRQRYALNFYLPSDVKPGQERNIEVQLASAALSRYPGAEVHYRRTYYSPSGSSNNGGSQGSDPTVISQAPAQPSSSGSEDPDAPRLKRRAGVSGPVSDGPAADNSGSSQGGWRRVDDPAPAPAAGNTPAPADNTAATTDQQPAQPTQGGWRKLKPGEQP